MKLSEAGDLMCFFVTIAVPEALSDDLQEIIPRGFAIEPAANLSVLASLPSRYSTFLLISGGCSCDLYRRELPSKPQEKNHLRRKYTKKGWSDAKIQRAIRQSSSQAHLSGFVGLRPDVVDIFSQIAILVPTFALLVHWYNGNVEEERIDTGLPQTITVDRLGDGVPKEDQLLWVTRN